MNEPYTSADFGNDWAKERQFLDLKAEEALKPRPHRTHYFPELSPKENQAEQLTDIVKENVANTYQNHDH